MKNIFNILLGIGITILSTASCTYAYTQEQQEAYQWAYKYNITTQPTIEKAKMNGNLTRQAFAKMVVNYLENVVGVKQSASNTCYFPDESKITGDLKPYARKTCALDIMWSNWKNFNPTKPLSRAQLGTVLSRILWWSEHDTSGTNYYIYHLNALKQNWIMGKIDNPQRSAKRWDVLIMLKRMYDKFGPSVYMNNNIVTENNNSYNNELNDDWKYLSQQEVQRIIEKEEWLKEGSLDSRWYECSWEKCNYEFEYSDNWKIYIYNRYNTASAKTEKVQDLWINYAENVALKDANVSNNNAKVEHSFSSNWYIITITTKDNVFVYTMSLDWKIKGKETLITAKKALGIMLKEAKLDISQADIGEKSEEICSLSFNETYHCAFAFWWKQYISYINAKDWTFIPIKKTASGIQYWKSVTWKENVIISEQYSYIDSDEAKELLVEKYNIKESGYWITKKWEGKNAIYVYTVLGWDDDSKEYYIDATNWTKMYSKDEIYTSLAKDSWVSKNIIKNSKKSLEERDSTDSAAVEVNYSDAKTKDVVSIYSFSDKWITYTYKVRSIDWKILDSKKENDIWEDKAVELARQTIQKKYSVNLQDEYDVFNWNRAYIRYLSSSSDDPILEAPSDLEYVVCFVDESEKNVYRVIVKYDGSIISEGKESMEELTSSIFAYGFYIMWYELDDLKDFSMEIWGTFSL